MDNNQRIDVLTVMYPRPGMCFKHDSLDCTHVREHTDVFVDAAQLNFLSHVGDTQQVAAWSHLQRHLSIRAAVGLIFSGNNGH